MGSELELDNSASADKPQQNGEVLRCYEQDLETEKLPHTIVPQMETAEINDSDKEDRRSLHSINHSLDMENTNHPAVSTSDVQGIREENGDSKRIDSLRSGLEDMERQETASTDRPTSQETSGLNNHTIKPVLNSGRATSPSSLQTLSSRKLIIPCAEERELETRETTSKPSHSKQDEVCISTTTPPINKPFVIWINGRDLHQNGAAAHASKSSLAEKEKKKTSSPSSIPASLPVRKPHKMDTGWAWMVLFGATLLHMLADGVISSLGIFLVTWREQFPENTTSEISVILCLIFGGAYIAGKFIFIREIAFQTLFCMFNIMHFVVMSHLPRKFKDWDKNFLLGLKCVI